MSEKSVWLARHGQTEWNKEGRYQGQKNSDLTTLGREQATLLGKFLQDKNISKIYASPLGRALETAKIVDSTLQLGVEIVPELAEMNFGLFEGKTKAETKLSHADFYARRNDLEQKIKLAYPDGESYEDVWQRLAYPILSLLANESDILLVAHNSVNKVVRGILLGQLLEQVVSHDQKNNQVVQIFPNLGEEKVHDV